MGAMAAEEAERCREILESLGGAVAAARGLEERRSAEKDSLNSS